MGDFVLGGFGPMGDLVLGDYIRWDFILGDFILGDFILGDFILGDLVRERKQTKLFSVKYHLFHERFQGGTVLLQYCHAENMQTDLLLKALSGVKVDKYHQALMSFSLTWSQLSLSGGY